MLQEGNSAHSVVKDVGCFQSAVSKCKHKQNVKVMKGKHTGRQRKMSKGQDRNSEQCALKIEKFTAKQMKNKWVKTIFATEL